MKDLEKTIVGIMFGKQIEEAKIKHPNQQVLDVYEPEKDELTAKDFEKLRAMKKGEVKKEEVESVEEDFGTTAAIAGGALLGAKIGKTVGIYRDAKSRERAGLEKPRKPLERLKASWKGTSHADYGDESKMKKEEVELDESIKTTHENPLVTVHDKNGLHTHANLSVANDIFGTEVKPGDVHKGEVKTKSRAGDVRFNISKHHEKAMKEEVEQIDELSPNTLTNYADKARSQGRWASGVALHPMGKLMEPNADAIAKKRFAGAKKADDKAGKQMMSTEEVEQFDEAAKPNELHVSDAGGGKYKVHAVGSNFADGIKVGEHLTDTHLDDFHEMGGKVKMLKPMKTNEEAPKTPSPFDWKNKPSELPTKKGEKAGFDSKKISTGTVYSRKPTKEDVDQSTSFYNDFEVQLQESYTFGDYLTAAKQLVEDTDAIEMANEMFKAQDTDIFVIESILKSGIQARINSQLDAGFEVSAPKYSIEDGIPSVEYVVTEQDGKRRQYIHFGSIV
jgi:hypothetical protein